MTKIIELQEVIGLASHRSDVPALAAGIQHRQQSQRGLLATPEDSPAEALRRSMQTPAQEAPRLISMQAPAREAPPRISMRASPHEAAPPASRSPPASVSEATPSSRDSLPPVRRKSALKAPTASAAGAMEPGVGKLGHMIGAHTERSTGMTYPFNMWGPCNPTRFGPVGEMPPERGHRYNYQGKHESLMKDRLEERDFGHVRHHCYRQNLVEPTGAESLAFMDPKRKEFWRTDVDRVLKRDEDKRRARQKEILEIMTNDEAQRRCNGQNLEDMKYKAYCDLSANKQKVMCQNNLSGAPNINIITREPIGEHNIKTVKFKDDCV